MLGGALAAAKVAAATPKLRELRKACDGIESAFLKQMLSAMHQANDALKGSDDLEGGTGSNDYKDMMDNALADRLASRGTLGIAKMTFHATAKQAMAERVPTSKEKPRGSELPQSRQGATMGQAEKESTR